VLSGTTPWIISESEMKWEGRWLDLAGLWADGGEEAMRAPRQVREEHLVLLPGVVA